MKLRASLAVGVLAASSVAFGVVGLGSVDLGNDTIDAYKQASEVVDTTALGTLETDYDVSRDLNMAPVASLETGATTDMQFQRREGGQVVDGEQVEGPRDFAFLGLSDIADFGGTTHGLSVVDITDPTTPVEIERLTCGGFHNDIAVWEQYVVIGHDGASAASGTGCEGAEDLAETPEGAGVWIFDATDPANLDLVAFFNAEGEGGLDLLRDGTHNLAIHPDGLVYFATASFDADNPGFGYVDLNGDPADWEQVVFPMKDVSPTASDGCHDMGFSLGNTYHDVVAGPDEDAIDLLVCPAIESTYIWDITDPKNPVELAAIANPAINIHHGGRFTPDGRTVVLGDELAGAGAPSGCFNGGPVGALWTYDVSLPESPVPTGYVSASESPGTIETCTSHFYNFVPNSEDRTQVMTGWYGSGMVSHDLTPLVDQEADVVSVAPLGAGPEVAHLEPAGAELWNAYAYRGYVYGGSYTGNTGFFVASLDGYTGTDDAELEPYGVDEGIVYGQWTPRDDVADDGQQAGSGELAPQANDRANAARANRGNGRDR